MTIKPLGVALGAAACLSAAQPAFPQSPPTTSLPPIVVSAPAARPRPAKPPRPSSSARAGSRPSHVASAPKPARAAAPVRRRLAAAPPPAAPAPASDGIRAPGIDPSAGPDTGGSLTVPSVQQQRANVLSTVGSVAFIDATSFQNRYTNNLPDVLKDTPGVFTQSRYGQEVRLSIRGSGIARSYHTRGIEMLLDGIPLNLADGSGDFYQIDPLSARSIEVYKGGNGLIFGSSMLGGAINIVTPTAYTAFGSNIVRVEGGSFGAIRTNVQASRVEGDADGLINATYSHQDGFRDHANQDYWQINGNVGYKIAPGIETRTWFGSFITRQKLPGTLDLNGVLYNPRQAAAAAISGNQARDVWAERIANRTSFALDVGTLDIDSWYTHKRLYHPIFQVIDQEGATYGIAPRWSGSFDIGGYRNELIVGARAIGGDNSARQYVNIAGNRGMLTASARQNAQNYEGYIDNRFWVTPELAVMAGAKLLHDERDFRNFYTIPARAADRDYDGFNPKIGLMYQPVKNVQFFTNLTRSRDIPDFSDLAQSNLSGLTFVPLQAQKAWTAEVGTRGSWDRFRWDVTYYHSTLRDELINFNTNAALGIPASTFNADRTTHQGVELAFGVDLWSDLLGPGVGDKLALRQVYTWNDFRFDHDPVYGNNRIAGIPQHVLRTILAYTHPSGFFIAPTLDWVPQGAFADHANTLRVPGYTLIGVQAGMELGRGVTLYVDARNLANKRYVSDIGAVADARKTATTIFYPGEGRSIFGGVRWVY
ncbi:TonB-dependent receptor [Enterovirga sp.]|uniref:TonB-dependent receptor family protein n=1 Tax=Enterovirga sp. TaxID=2026350 RepID=UPI002BE383F2|nr:TonB-dependent receptor [Enterovirga sp.]HMO29450.1 TonB-dependent receptor [Enterovirga sp.]